MSPGDASAGPVDVAIVGGGPVGATLAAALAGAGARVVLVEASARQPPGFDSRPLAISEGSRRILAGLGVWGPLAASAAAIRAIHVSERGGFGFVRMRAEEHGLDAFGHVVEARALGEALAARLGALPRIERARPARVVEVTPEPESVALAVEDESGAVRVVHARVVVAADGGRSGVRAMLGVPASETAYDQSAVTATLAPGMAQAGVAYERFAPGGPLALLPMADGRCGLVWTMRPVEARRVAALGDDAFRDAVQEGFGFRLGRLGSPGPRAVHSLRLVRSRHVVSRRAALVGSAAHHLHPVAGQGLNLGLRDAAALADVLAAALRDGVDPGADGVLADYAARRRTDRRDTIRLTHGLVRLFGGRLAPLALARSAGMLALDLAPPAKRAFVRRAAGLAGSQPRLARGLPP